MTPSPLTRFAGPIALAAGGLFTATQLVMAVTLDRTDFFATVSDPVYLVSSVTQFAAFCILLLALVAVYGREAREAGTFGLIGVSAAVVGTMHLAGNYWFEVFAVPWLVQAAPEVLSAPRNGLLVIGGLSSYMFFAIGWMLFGIASFRARVFPAAISVAIVVAGLVGYRAAAPPFGVPLGLTIAALGWWLITRATAAREDVPAETRALSS
jgi:hypothetical protein